MRPLLLPVYVVIDKINPEYPNRFDTWLDKKYYASCGGPRIVWRFWFEITDQGRYARQYARMIGATRWGRYKRRRQFKKYGRPTYNNYVRFPEEEE